MQNSTSGRASIPKTPNPVHFQTHFRRHDPPMNSPNRRHKSRRETKSPVEEPSQTSIADLPLSILVHIVSFLPTFDAIRVAAVAPPWRHLWHSLPALEFCMNNLYRRFPNLIFDRRDARRRFSEFVTRALRNRPRHFPIQALKIQFFYRNTDEIRATVNSWIRMVVDLRVVDLHLEFIGQGKRNWYEFCFSEIVSSSKKVLRLQCCTLDFPREQVYLHSIRELQLGPYIGNAGAIEHLISLCIYLETFVFVFSVDSIPDLNIVSGSLRHLKINGLGAIETQGSRSVNICTPRLESLELVGLCLGMYTIKDASSLVEATVGFSASSWWGFASWSRVVSSLSGVERLTIKNNNLDGDGEVPYKTYEDVRRLIEERESFRDVSKLKFGEEVFSETFVFQNLKCLTLKTGYSIVDIRSLESILKKCPRLETLVLVCYGYTLLDDQLKEDEIAAALTALHIPRLREVKLEEYLGTKNELVVVDLLKKNGAVLEKIMAFPARVGRILPPPFLL